MASPFSTDQIIETLRADDSEKRTPKVWSYITTKPQKCFKCGANIKPGGCVEVAYNGVIAQFSHANGCPPASPKNNWASRIVQGSK